MSRVARVEGTRASMPVPPLSTHSESSASENTRLRKRLKYSSWIRLLMSSDGSAAAARLAASLIAFSTPRGEGYGSGSATRDRLLGLTNGGKRLRFERDAVAQGSGPSPADLLHDVTVDELCRDSARDLVETCVHDQVGAHALHSCVEVGEL